MESSDATRASDHAHERSMPPERPVPALPMSLPPRGLSRVQAAEYVGISPSLFDEMVDDKRMPKPRMINKRRIWDLKQLDKAFDALPHAGPGGFQEPSPWDDLVV